MAHPNSKRAKNAKAKRKASRAAVDKGAHQRRIAHSNERRSERESRRRRQRVKRKLQNYGIVATLAVVVSAGGWLIFRPGPELAGVERPAYGGRGHVTNPTYSDGTPTSGAHLARAPACGTYTAPLQLGAAVHALEHGAVVLWYDSADPSLGSELEVATSRWDSHVIISPSSGLDSPVVATAWNRRMGYADAGSDVTEFVDTYRRRGPEKVRCERT